MGCGLKALRRGRKHCTLALSGWRKSPRSSRASPRSRCSGTFELTRDMALSKVVMTSVSGSSLTSLTGEEPRQPMVCSWRHTNQPAQSGCQ